MNCPKCNSPIKSSDAFCGSCGSQLSNLHTEKTKPLRRVFPLLAIIAVVSIIFVLIISNIHPISPRNSLKYSWGTSLDYIKNNEYVTKSEYDSVKCEDPKHTVDNLHGFEIKKDLVTYGGGDTSRLKSISYSFEEMTFARRVMIVEEYYGDKYFIAENFNEKYYANAIWEKGDTVVLLDYYCIVYYDADYFWEEGPRLSDDELEDAKKFFGKR